MWVEIAQRIFLFLFSIGVGWVGYGSYRALLSIASDTMRIRKELEDD